MSEIASIINRLQSALKPDQWQQLLRELRARDERAYRRGLADGYADGQKAVPPAPARRPIVSEATLTQLRGALRSGTVRLGALVMAASAALLDEGLRAQVAALAHQVLGPGAGPLLGIATGVAVIVQRYRTVMSLAQRGAPAPAPDKPEEAPGA